MAVMTQNELVELRKEIANNETVTWDKNTVNLALQAIEDWFESSRATLAGNINTATSPFVFTNPQKRKLLAYFMKQKFRRENI